MPPVREIITDRAALDADDTFENRHWPGLATRGFFSTFQIIRFLMRPEFYPQGRRPGKFWR
jgi:hypothetical protein